MSRHAKILYETPDAEGWAWDVREERDTEHGFPILLGWPTGVPRGQAGCGGPAAIPTTPLVAYMQLHRDAPGQMQLPLGKHTITRLRRLLGHHRYQDRAAWWEARIDDLLALSGEQFCAKHGSSIAAASIWRRRLGDDRRARPADWWREPKVLSLLRSGMSTYAIAHALNISTSLAWSGRQRAMQA